MGEKNGNKFKRMMGSLWMIAFCILLCHGFSCQVRAAVSVKNVKTIAGGKFVKKANGEYAYKKQDGKLVKNSIVKIKGKTYYFSESGYRQSGWQKLEKNYYYFGKKSEGYMYTSKWIVLNGKKYYVKSNGSMTIGWLTIGGKRYYFDKNGCCVKGKQKISGQDFCFDSSGKLLYRGPKLTIYSDCAILVEASTGKIIYGKNEKTAHANASTTKILTCILALEKGSLSDKVTASSNVTAIPSRATKLGMKKGNTFTKRDLLYSLMLPSHNDTAIALAEYVSGSTTKFVKKMNKKAKEIGCTNTNFVTPNGLDSGLNHYSTALDLSKIARYAMKNSTFRQIVATRSYRVKNQRTGNSCRVYTTNSLLGNMTGVIGMKTGYTKKAGNCFVGAIRAKNGKTYISVTLGAATEAKRWSDAKTLLQYAHQWMV